MMTMEKYAKPSSLEEAYNLLKSVPDSQVLGGGIFLRLSPKDIKLGIDLYNLGLNYIREDGDSVEIGAMTTFRVIEVNRIIMENFDILSHAVRDIVGVQFRNSVTIGGNIFPKYGFSDLITALLVLDCKVVLFKAGEMALDDYLRENNIQKDILTKIVLKKENIKSSYKSFRNSAGDYSILNAAVSKGNDGYKVAVGARPGVATIIPEVAEFLNSKSIIDEDTAFKAGEIASENISFGSNYLASAEYRKDICKVLVKRGIMEVTR